MILSQDTATQSQGHLNVPSLPFKDLSWLIIDQGELQHLPQPVINPGDKANTFIYFIKLLKELRKGFFRRNYKGAEILLLWLILKNNFRLTFLRNN